MCLKTSIVSPTRIMNPSDKECSPRGTAIGQLPRGDRVSHCQAGDILRDARPTFVPNPTRKPEAAIIGRLLTLGRIDGGTVDRNAPIAMPPQMSPPTEKAGSRAPW